MTIHFYQLVVELSSGWLGNIPLLLINPLYLKMREQGQKIQLKYNTMCFQKSPTACLCKVSVSVYFDMSRFFLADPLKFIIGDRQFALQFVLEFKFNLWLGHSRTRKLEASPALPWLGASSTCALPIWGCVSSAAGLLLGSLCVWL